MRVIADVCSKRFGDCVGMAVAGCLLIALSSSGGEADGMFRMAGRIMAATGAVLTVLGVFGGRGR